MILRNFFLLLILTFFLEGGENYDFKGNHFIASFKKCSPEAIYDNDGIKKVMEEAISKTGATIIGQCDYAFEPQGYTLVYLLSESHASIHTYPDLQACFIDLFTCGDHCDWKPYFEDLKNYLKAEEVNGMILERSDTVKIKSVG